MNIKLKERPNKKISKTEQVLSIIKNNKIVKAFIKYEKDRTKITCEGKEFFIGADYRVNGFSMEWDDKFYRRIQELVGGKIIGCINCKYYKFSGLMYDQTKGHGGNCVFPSDVSNKRSVFNDFGEGFDNYKVQRSDGFKNTTILDYCTEFDLEDKNVTTKIIQK